MTARIRHSGTTTVCVAGPAVSRCGVPFDSRGEDRKDATGRHHPLFLTGRAVRRLRARRDAGEPVAFGQDVWPPAHREDRAVCCHAAAAYTIAVGTVEGE